MNKLMRISFCFIFTLVCVAAGLAQDVKPAASLLGEWREHWGTTDVTYHDQYRVSRKDDMRIKVTILNRKQLITDERVEKDTLTFTQHTDAYVVKYSLTIQPDNKWMIGTATTPREVVEVKWERTK